MIPFCKGKYCLVWSICILMPVFSLFSQQRYHTLAGLEDSAARYLPLLLQKRALVKSSRAAVTEARHSFLPQVKFNEQVSLGSDNSLAGTYFPFGIVPSTSGGIRNDNNYNPAAGNLAVLYGEYEWINFGLRNARIRNAEAYTDLQEADLNKELYYTQLEIARLYFSIIRNQYRLAADGQNIERYENIFRVIQALAASGIKPGADSALAKAELSKTKISYNQTRGRINQLKEQLSYLTGIPARGIQLDTASISYTRILPGITALQPDSSGNPVIDYYSRKKDVLLANEKLITKSYLPKVLLTGSTWARGSSIAYNDHYKSLFNGMGYQRFNYAVGVSFSYNLFNGIYKKDKLAVNRLQVEAGEYELQQQKLAWQTASAQAANVLQTVKDNLAELPVQLQSAQTTYQQKLAQYRAGLITLVDLTNASFVLYRSQTDYIETLSDWYVAQLDKAAADGSLTQFIQKIN